MSARLEITNIRREVVAHAIVDDCDGSLAQRRWHFCGAYAATSLDGREVLLHRLLTDAAPGTEVDHRNGVKLDNRRGNLRVVTPGQNKQNVAVHHDNPSGYRGVSWAPHVRLWRGRVHHNGRTHCCGYHATPEEAALAVGVKRRELMTHSEESRHGPYAVR